MIGLAKDPWNDLSNRAVAKQVAAVVSQFDVLGVDILCNTWSRARRAPVWSSMPSALRDNSHLFGLPHLNDRGRNTIRKHNCMCRKCMEYATLSINAKRSGWIENPRTSMLWKTPGIKRLLRLGGRFVDAHFCQYGTSYKKATRFLVWGPKSGDVVLSTCCGRRGVCSRTGRRHV